MQNISQQNTGLYIFNLKRLTRSQEKKDIPPASGWPPRKAERGWGREPWRKLSPQEARGPTPAALLLARCPRGLQAELSPRGAWDQKTRTVRRRPLPLLGLGESKLRGLRTAPRLGNRWAEHLGPGPNTSPGRTASPATLAGIAPGVQRGTAQAQAQNGPGAREGTAQARARWGLRGRLVLAARAALRRWTDPPAHTAGTPPWLLPRGAASLARWLRAWAGRRARPVARPESVESGLRVAANPAAPFARPALRPPLARPTRLRRLRRRQ